MERSNQLVVQRNDLTVSNKISLTVSQQTLAVEIHLTALNAKTEPDDALTAEYDRVFASEPALALQWAFRTWRDNSQFFPAICDVQRLLSEWHKEARERQREVREKQEREHAQADWEEYCQQNNLPKGTNQREYLLKQAADKIKDRPPVLPFETKHSPRNVVALKQSRVLRDIGKACTA